MWLGRFWRTVQPERVESNGLIDGGQGPPAVFLVEENLYCCSLEKSPADTATSSRVLGVVHATNMD